MSKLKTLDSKLLIPQSGLSPDQYLPYLIDVDVFEQAVSHVNWDIIQTTSNDLLNGSKISTGVQNAEINFDMVLAAGTWTIELLHRRSNDAGIMSVQLDGIEKGAIDIYSSATSYNVLSSILNVTIATSGKKQLKLKMSSKNASSLNYYGAIQHIQLRRTDTPAGPVTTTANGDKLPWLIDINSFMTPISHVGWNTNTLYSSAIYNGSRTSSGAQNAEINFDVVLGAGTWTIEAMYMKSSGSGIYTFQIDGATVGTIDTYLASTTYNNLSSISNISIINTGKKRLKIIMATKNSSASGYFGYIQHIQLRRTA